MEPGALRELKFEREVRSPDVRNALLLQRGALLVRQL
jgi:hypothetical protein